tara:strand:+ start:237 stop:749 length:513 start_codon:yes stop_codon:yes gene_type:complete
MHSIDGILLHHAPLTLAIDDCRFSAKGLGPFILTSIHLPPSKNSRDDQLKAIVHGYNKCANIRLDYPFSEKGARDARVEKPIHIIAGDFNMYPGLQETTLIKNGWALPLLGRKVVTSSGRKHYDNFLMDKESSERLQLSAETLELTKPQLSQNSQIGLSDHHPILLTIKM